ncbi:hypothetical protein SKAU_G00256170 [Synaphobranchus kaupii]|uniref:Uncharacterized protein n=1 Tax=Synaphobranchus kaupii TaxID=118154 RepID=A0A9Q1F3S7_SYNKA|nr:hypothetical protein SKAU_G00256170 [Synaphobranchus kaupii]
MLASPEVHSAMDRSLAATSRRLSGVPVPVEVKEITHRYWGCHACNLKRKLPPHSPIREHYINCVIAGTAVFLGEVEVTAMLQMWGSGRVYGWPVTMDTQTDYPGDTKPVSEGPGRVVAARVARTGHTPPSRNRPAFAAVRIPYQTAVRIHAPEQCLKGRSPQRAPSETVKEICILIVFI